MPGAVCQAVLGRSEHALLVAMYASSQWAAKAPAPWTAP